MQVNSAAIYRTYELKEAAVKKQHDPFIDRVMYWLEGEEPAGQRIACYGFLALAAIYFIGGVIRVIL